MKFPPRMRVKLAVQRPKALRLGRALRQRLDTGGAGESAARDQDEPTSGLRLLPWQGPEGKPCYLSTNDQNSFMSRMADNMEAVQIGLGEDLLDHVSKVLAQTVTSETELRNLINSLCQALRDALRVAESRGDRLPRADDDASAIAARVAIDREFVR
ncbi:hypothetical protein SAMN05216251_11841 [Actinacidiphila alni]|uniref:Uncharacterized protein n=1 Tax=Actinacidiphila alni TaxID=380248 RepID=A0A1I2JH75_9ACTN|nr:hypothetical protein [Actinacidiphila alni]SFF54205.1 hypothetical protein SAMN05216251_11841 [Actinacidiphila alni]